MGKGIVISATGIVLVLIAIGAVILLIGNFPMLTIGESSMTIKSVDFVDRISNDDQLQDSKYRILAQIGNGGEEIVGIISRSDLENGDGGGNGLPLGWESEFPLEIRAKIEKETALYSIIADDTSFGKLYEYYWFFEEDPLFGSPTPCGSSIKKIRPEDKIIQDWNVLLGDLYCLAKTQIGKSGRLDQPTVRVDARFSFKAGETSRNTLISNFGSNSGVKEILDSSGNRIGSVKMTQDSQSVGANPPDEDAYKAVYISGANKWNIHSLSDWLNYRGLDSYISGGGLSNLKSQLLSCNNGNCVGIIFRDYIDSVNSDVNYFKGFSNSLSDGSTIIDQNGESSSRVEYSPNNVQLTNVELLFEADAEWIGVRSLVSKPKITSLICPDFESGKEGRISVNVLNNGPVTSQFDVDLFGSNGIIRQISDTAQISILPGQTRVFVLDIDASETSNGVQDVVIKAFNVERPETLFDTASVRCEVKAPSLCIDGEQITSKVGNNLCVFECSQGSFQEDPIMCCANGIDSYIDVDGKKKYQCVDDIVVEPGECGAWIEIGGTVIVPDLFCKTNKWILEFRVTFSLIVGFLAGLVTWLASRKWLKSLTKSEAVFLITGLVIGIALGFLAYFYFWFAIITLIILLIFRMVL